MGIYEGLKDAAKVLQEAGKIEQYKEILAALEQLLDMRKKTAELEGVVADLNQKLEIKGKLSLRNNAYWMDGDNEPICTRCWEVEHKVVHLHPDGNPAYYNCPNCESGSVKAKPEKDTPARVFHPVRNDCR